MIQSIFILLICLLGLPIYAVSVVFLLVLGEICGWSYVESSVYICEYVQPLFTAAVAIVFLILALRKLPAVQKKKTNGALVVLSLICLIYIVTAGVCFHEFIHRIAEYRGMTDTQIFDYVVQKLSKMAQSYPAGRIRLFTGESISYGYIMANMIVYILPLSIVLLGGFLQWRLTRKVSSFIPKVV